MTNKEVMLLALAIGTYAAEDMYGLSQDEVGEAIYTVFGEDAEGYLAVTERALMLGHEQDGLELAIKLFTTIKQTIDSVDNGEYSKKGLN